MKYSSKLVLASWQVLKEIPDDLPGLLERKQPIKLSSLTTGNFLWATIKSYATEIGTRKVLPPFIHRTCCKNNSGGGDLDFSNLPKPLANCFSRTPMHRQKTPACKHLVYRTLILEVQRLHDEVRLLPISKQHMSKTMAHCVQFQTYDEQTLLYALQAVTIYIIILAEDTDSCKNISVFVRIALGVQSFVITTSR